MNNKKQGKAFLAAGTEEKEKAEEQGVRPDLVG